MTQTIDLTFSLRLTIPDGVQLVSGPTAAAVVEQLPPPAVLADVLELPTAKATTAKRPLRLGKLQRALLWALASRHGRVSDPNGKAAVRLSEIAGASSVESTSTALKRLEEEGLVDRTMPNARRTSRIVLTGEGWSAIGQTPPQAETIDTRPRPAAKPAGARLAVPVLGPIERRPFDPDEVRATQADLEYEPGL